jgi:hypothetical protein
MFSITIADRLSNACNITKKYINFDDLPIGEYAVKHFQLEKSKFGERLEAQLSSGVIIGLPERFYREFSTQEDVDALNSAQRIMVYQGKEKKQNNRILLKFKTQNIQKPHQNATAHMETDDMGIDTVDTK